MYLFGEALPNLGTVVKEEPLGAGTLRKVIDRIAYPQNGNAHNPTIYYRWELVEAGRVILRAYRRRDILEAL